MRAVCVLILLGMSVLPGVAWAQGAFECKPPKRTEINVIPRSLKIKYDFSQSLTQIQSAKIDTVSPHSFGQTTYTQGYMAGGLRISPQVKIGTMSAPALNKACAWYDTIDIVIEIDPTIVIAKEVAANTCMKRAVMEHEMKHVNVDREIANDLAKALGANIYSALKQRGFSSDVFDTGRTDYVVKTMQDTLAQVVKLEWDRIQVDRQQAQQHVDTREEYERVAALCSEFDELGQDYVAGTLDENSSKYTSGRVTSGLKSSYADRSAAPRYNQKPYSRGTAYQDRLGR